MEVNLKHKCVFLLCPVNVSEVLRNDLVEEETSERCLDKSFNHTSVFPCNASLYKNVLMKRDLSVLFFLEWGLYNLLADRITEVQSLQLFSLVPFQQVFLPMVATFGAAGLFVGMFGSVMSIRKFLDV